MKTKRHLTFLLACCTAILSGCGSAVTNDTEQSNTGDSSGIFASTQSIADTVASVLDISQQMLDDGDDIESTRAAMLSKLQGTANVEFADIDESSDVIWADFDNGETRLFAIFDDEREGHDADTWSELLEEADVTDSSDGFSDVSLPTFTKVRRTQQSFPELPPSNFRMPASNRALVANGLTPFHDTWPHEDNRPLIAKMLSDRGYVVEQTDLTVEMFTHLSDYGVIYTESHGGWRASSIRDMGVDPSGLDPTEQVPTCFGSPGNQWLLTTTEVTKDNRSKYQKDVDCRRLMIMDATLKSPLKPTEKKEFYCVTPLFMREYDKKRFPDRTVMFLNSCRGFDPKMGSHFKDALDARCASGTYIAWSNRVHPVAAFRSALNFFQLMTGSDEELAADQIVFLEKNIPPITNMSIAEAHANMVAKGLNYGIIPGRNAMLFYLTKGSETEPAPILVLAPAISDFFLDELGNGALFARTPDEADLLIGDLPGLLPDVTSVSINIGRLTGLQTTHISGTGYALKVPVGAEGEIRLRKGNRTGPPMQLHTWQPSFVVKGSGPNGLTFTATFLMHARALAAPRARSGGLGTFLWVDPMEAFDARFDGASTVTWSVSGSATVNGDRYEHRGGGTQTISFQSADGTTHTAFFKSENGQNAEIDFTVEIPLSYTTTITGNGTQSTQENNLPIGDYTYGNAVQLSPDWTLQSGSTQLFFTQSDWSANMTWNASSPTPLYNYQKYRR